MEGLHLVGTEITAESSASIERPVQDVWAFVSNPSNEPRWHTDIVDIKSAGDPAGHSPESWAVGATWLVTVQFMGRRQYEVEITAVEPMRRIEITTKTGPMKPIASYEFQGADGHTRFTRRVDMPLSGPMRLLAPLMRGDLRKRNARFVQNLKELLET